MVEKNSCDFYSFVLRKLTQFLESWSPGKITWNEGSFDSAQVQTNLTSFLNNFVVTLFLSNQVKTYHRVCYSALTCYPWNKSVILYIPKSVSFLLFLANGWLDYITFFFFFVFFFHTVTYLLVCLHLYKKFSTIFCVTALHALDFTILRTS